MQYEIIEYIEKYHPEYQGKELSYINVVKFVNGEMNRDRISRDNPQCVTSNYGNELWVADLPEAVRMKDADLQCCESFLEENPQGRYVLEITYAEKVPAIATEERWSDLDWDGSFVEHDGKLYLFTIGDHYAANKVTWYYDSAQPELCEQYNYTDPHSKYINAHLFHLRYGVCDRFTNRYSRLDEYDYEYMVWNLDEAKAIYNERVQDVKAAGTGYVKGELHEIVPALPEIEVSFDDDPEFTALDARTWIAWYFDRIPVKIEAEESWTNDDKLTLGDTEVWA